MSQRKSMAKRGSMKRQSKVSRKSMSRKSMQRKSQVSGGRRKSMGKGHSKKNGSIQEKPGAMKMARRGRDKFSYPNGDKYEGDWLAIYPDIFVRDGEGTYTFSDGTIYNGLWELDLLETGTIMWPCGQKYSGDFQNGKMHGIGTYTLPGRGELSGTFHENLPFGNVVFLDLAGMKYAGRVAPNASTVRLKMMNHLLGGFLKEELILPEPPPGMEDDDLAGKKGSRSDKKGTRRQSSKKRKSKSKSTSGSRKSMKRKSMKRKSRAK